ncbi:MAG TPA: SDR family NAD(P)-dependent oxidoreductase [Anaerolineales bacterium]
MVNLRGKVALITGGSSGIGRATAFAFAQAGAQVIIATRRIQRGEETVREIVNAGGNAFFIQADMTRAADIEHLITQTVQTLIS